MEVKEILNTHRSILQKNIVPCEEFYSALIQYNVFTETMIQDIRSQPSRECRVDRLLSLLCLLPRPARVCAALLQSGQAFIANFLEDKFSGEPSTKVDTTDVKEKLPTIRTELPDKGITELKSYIEEKVQEILIQQKWRRDSAEIDRAITAKAGLLQEKLKFAEAIKEKDCHLNQQQLDMETILKESVAKDKLLTEWEGRYHDLKRKYDNDMLKQIRFNDANNNTLRRLQQRETEIEKILTELLNTMGDCPQVYDSVLCSNKTKSMVESLLSKMDELLQIQSSYTDLNDELYEVLKQQGYEADAEQNIRDAFVDCFLKKNEHLEELYKEIAIVKDQKKVLVEEMTECQVQIEDLHMQMEEMSKKNLQLASEKLKMAEKIKQLEDEIQRLRNPPVERPKSKSSSTSTCKLPPLETRKVGRSYSHGLVETISRRADSPCKKDESEKPDATIKHEVEMTQQPPEQETTLAAKKKERQQQQHTCVTQQQVHGQPGVEKLEEDKDILIIQQVSSLPTPCPHMSLPSVFESSPSVNARNQFRRHTLPRGSNHLLTPRVRQDLTLGGALYVTRHTSHVARHTSGDRKAVNNPQRPPAENSFYNPYRSVFKGHSINR